MTSSSVAATLLAFALLAAPAHAMRVPVSSQGQEISLLSLGDWKALVRHNAASNPHATFDENDLAGFLSWRAASPLATPPAAGQGMAPGKV